MPSLSHNAHLILLTETWEEAGAGFSLPGYTCLSLPKHFQHLRARRPSGGIAAFIRNEFAPYVSRWRPMDECTHMWLRISAKLGLERDLFLCLCYIPPQNSTYYTSLAEHPLSVITREAHLAASHGSILLAGDFNARTGVAPDWLDFSELKDVYKYLEGSTNPASFPPPPPPRKNNDNKLSTLGKHLLEMCRECQLFIVNGRTPSDAAGDLTCFNHNNQGASTVDYFIADPNFFEKDINDMQVLPCPETPLGKPLSDHRPLSLVSHLRPPSLDPPSLPTKHKHPKHIPRFLYHPNPDNIDAFAVNIASDPLLSCSHLSSLTTDEASTTFQTRIMHHVACTHRPIDTSRPRNPHKHKHQPWFDKECKEMRRRFHASRRLPHTNLAEQARLEYRRLTARKKKLWNEARLAQLLEDARHSPANFWRVFRKKGKTLKIESAVQWYKYFKQLLAAPNISPTTCSPLPPIPPDVTARRAAAAGSLNSPFSELEVGSAIQRLRKNKAAGIDGMKAEFLLDAALPLPSDCDAATEADSQAEPLTPGPLLPPLTLVLNKIFLGTFPSAWSTQVIQPIFKDGDVLDCNNYRGISVGPVLAKLYAMVLEARITQWAEEQGVRAESQAGFRPGRRTTDHIFTLQTLFDKTRASKTPLYCCFVDFKKAFDWVPRDLLWQRLSETGIHGTMLAALKSMYQSVRACVATPQGLTDHFECNLGVKQGCPLSPLLFGLYIDGLERLIHTCDGAPPSLHGLPVPMLLYADDLLLMSTSPQGLQTYLDNLKTFCDSSQLRVNLTKTQIVISQQSPKSKQSPPQWHFDGKRVKVIPQYKYLGLIFDQKHGFTRCVEKLNSAGHKALQAMYKRCQELKLDAPSVMVSLFDSLVRPILSYGCEIWSPYPRPNPMSEQAEILHRGFLKRCAGVAQATTTDIVYGEFGRCPLHVFWSKLSTRYFERLQNYQEGSLLTSAYKESTALHNAGHPSWVAFYQQQAAAPDWAEAWEARLAASEAGSKLHSYGVIKARFSAEKYLSEGGVPRQHRIALARLRMGSHWLGTQLGVYARAAERKRVISTPCSLCGDVSATTSNPMLLCDSCDQGWHCSCLSQPMPDADEVWFCPQCVSSGATTPTALNALNSRIFEAMRCPQCGTTEDEQHAVFACELYSVLRHQFADLFAGVDCLREFFQNDNVARLAEFIFRCYRTRQSVVTTQHST